MKRFSLLLLASSLACSALAVAATRPHYGGTLRVVVGGTPQSLDPVSLAESANANISCLLFDTMVTLDDRGRPQPSLATSWQSEPGNQRWRIFLRDGVSFSDGMPLDAKAVAASLRSGNPEWKVLTAGDTVFIESANPDAALPTKLALPRNGIVRRENQQLLGTGPFSVSQWVPGKHLSLAANDQYWAGRPYVDSVEIDFNNNDRDRTTALDLGKSDIVEVAPENILRTKSEGHTVVTSQPTELLALVFANEPRSDDETHARNALAASIDVVAINNVVLQGGGEPSGALLPNWLSGYAFLFPAPTKSDRARLERAQAKQVASLTLAYNPADPIGRTISERILLNARDAGINLQLVTTGHADLSLVRISLVSADPATALTEVAMRLQLPEPKLTGTSVSDLYSVEKFLLQSHRVIPLLHLRTGAALATNVHNLRVLPNGTWQLSNVWLATEKP